MHFIRIIVEQKSALAISNIEMVCFKKVNFLVLCLNIVPRDLDVLDNTKKFMLVPDLHDSMLTVSDE